MVAFQSFAQLWKPAMEGIHPTQPYDIQSGFSVKFKHDLGGKDWMYGSFYDEDSIKRVIAYRKGGKWVPLPISFYKGSRAKDIDMYGDTLIIGGSFIDIKLDNDSSFYVYGSYLLKWYDDSLWLAPQEIVGVNDMTTSGDTLLIWGGSYYNPPVQVIYHVFMTPDAGQTWHYPYSVIHPTETTANFGGATPRIEIVNGEIITLNNGSPSGSPYRGISRWDGTQWHSYGQGIFGAWARAFDFDFYKGDTYMGGTFWKIDNPLNPGNFIARWDGNQWHNVGGGTDYSVFDIFTHDSLLYCYTNGTMFGDARIDHFAAWDGRQWCGTPTGYFSQEPTSYGFANDTLFASFYSETTLHGDTLPYLIYFDGNYAKGDSSICSTPGLSIKDNELPSFNIYPNPTNSLLTIDGGQIEIETVRVFDLQGRDLISKEFKNGLYVEEVNLSNLATGIYIIQVNNNFTKKIIKH